MSVAESPSSGMEGGGGGGGGGQVTENADLGVHTTLKKYTLYRTVFSKQLVLTNVFLDTENDLYPKPIYGILLSAVYDALTHKSLVSIRIRVSTVCLQNVQSKFE